MSHLPDLQEEKVERKRAFAVLLRKHRKAVSLTQKLLAELAGFERKAVMRWENADIEAMPDREAIMKMAVPLKLTDVARDMLLATAGYLPENQETFFEPAPIQSEIKPQLDRMEGKLDELAGEVTGDKMVAPTRIPNRRLNGLVGREDDLAWLRQQLTGPGIAALAGVRGIGGIGKTALAIEAAWELRDQFPGGVIWLECGPHSVSAIQDIWAGHLGARLEGENEEVRANQLHMLLANHPQALVVLDDMREAHQRARRLLQPPPPHALLVTSRRDDVLPFAAQRQVEELSDAAARALLAQEVGDGVPAAAADEVVADLLRLLENIPLAVILAGRWVQRKLARRSPPADPMGFLHTELTRQRALLLDQHKKDKTLSLRVTFHISYEELDEPAQWRVRQLGAFARNRFDVVGLALMWQLEEDEAKRHRAIQQLVTVGLLQEIDDNLYWMHDVLRDYAAQYLGDGDDELGQARQKHARYCERILTALELRGLESWEWLYGFLPEATRAGEWVRNDWAQNPVLAAELAIAFGNSLYSVDAIPLVDWLNTGIEAAETAEAERDKAILQTRLAYLLSNRGQYDEAERLYRASLAVKEAIGDSRGVAVTQSSLADLLRNRGQYDEAERLYRASLAVFEAIGDSRGVAVTQSSLADLLSNRGQYDEAERLYRASLAVFEAIGDSRGVAVTQSSLAYLLRNRGQYDEAERLYRASLAFSEAIGDSRGVAVTNVGLADLLAAKGEVQAAVDLYQSSLALFQQINDLMSLGATLTRLAQLALRVQQPADAVPLLQQAQALFTQLKATQWLAQVAQLLDAAQSHTGD